MALLLMSVLFISTAFAGTEEYMRDTKNGLDRKIYLPYDIYDPADEEMKEGQ